MEHKGKATLITHSAVFGVHRTEVRSVRTSILEPYAQYARAVRVSFQYPRMRNWRSCLVAPENIYFVTVEVGGKNIYDSRSEVPCDMAKWEEAYRRVRADEEAIRRELQVTLPPAPTNGDGDAGGRGQP